MPFWRIISASNCRVALRILVARVGVGRRRSTNSTTHPLAIRHLRNLPPKKSPRTGGPHDQCLLPVSPEWREMATARYQS